MSEEQKYMMAVPGDNVTALHMNNEINIFGMYTSIKTTQFVTYPMIQDAIKAVEKKVENEDTFWRNLAIGAIATVALAAAAVAVVCTGGAALAAFALAGAAVGTGLVTAGASIADYKSGSARSTGDFLVQMVTGGVIGAVAGAAIYMVAPVLPGASSMMSAGICAEFGISSAAAGTALTYGMIGGGYLSLAGSTAFAADQAFALGSGESVLLETVFEGKQDAYDTAFMVCDMLTMGYMDMCMQYRMTCGSQTVNTADDATDETGQENKKNVNMDASENNADDTNGTGPKNAKASTNTTGNAADDAETSGISGKKSGVYLEEGETPVESGGKTDVLAQNRENGRAFEQQQFAKFSSQHNNAVEQITVKTSSGVRTRVDAIGLDANGNVVINEYKSSLTAPLTNNQKIAFPEIYESGATVVGKGKGIFSGGYQIPPGTKVTIIRPK